VVNAMRSTTSGRHTCMLTASLHSWQIGHINRNANSVTHSLAKTAVKQIIGKVWMEKNLIVSVRLFC